MKRRAPGDDPVAAVALLDEPRRRQLYEYVAVSPEPVGRDEAARAIGISRELAAFHLDRLVGAGMLTTEYRRLGPRRGPGAGRPAKLYRRAERELRLSFPPRDYQAAADVFARALDRQPGTAATDAVIEIARANGRVAGMAAREAAPGTNGRGASRPDPAVLRASLVGLLRQAGYEPLADSQSGAIHLHNCPFHVLARSHRDLTCGMNQAWAEGVVDGLGAPLEATFDPAPDRCCVVFREPGDGARRARGDDR
jgi:predicted ArsR family transcriptional regulator